MYSVEIKCKIHQMKWSLREFVPTWSLYRCIEKQPVRWGRASLEICALYWLAERHPAVCQLCTLTYHPGNENIAGINQSQARQVPGTLLTCSNWGSGPKYVVRNQFNSNRTFDCRAILKNLAETHCAVTWMEIDKRVGTDQRLTLFSLLNV